MSQMVADFLPVLVPSALLLWLLRDVATLKTMMAKEAERSSNVNHRLNEFRSRQIDNETKIQELSTRVDLIEWRMDEISKG